MKKLLIVVDCQNDFIDGALGFDKAKNIKDIIIKKIETYKKEDQTVIFTMDTHDENYLNTVEGEFLPIKHCIKGTTGHEIDKDINKYTNGCLIIEKSSFGSIELAKYLEQNHYDSIELCGLVSNICVLSNAIIAKTFSPKSKIYIDRNATISHLEVVNETLDVYLNSLGIK